MTSNANSLAYLDALLRARLAIAEARHGKVFADAPIRSGITPTTRLILFTAGRAEYTFEDQTFSISPGTMLLVPALAKRGWRAMRSVRMSFFAFQCEPDLPALGVMRLSSAKARPLAPAMRRVIAAAADPSRGGRLLADAEAKALLARFILLADSPAAPAGRASSPIVDAMQWLAKNLHTADPFDRLHERAGLGVNQFRRDFKALTGRTPRDYLLDQRMRQARYQLVHTDRSVKQIARGVGFDDPSYFSRRYHGFWKRWPTDERRLPSS